MATSSFDQQFVVDLTTEQGRTFLRQLENPVRVECRPPPSPEQTQAVLQHLGVLLKKAGVAM